MNVQREKIDPRVEITTHRRTLKGPRGTFFIVLRMWTMISKNCFEIDEIITTGGDRVDTLYATQQVWKERRERPRQRKSMEKARTLSQLNLAVWLDFLYRTKSFWS